MVRGRQASRRGSTNANTGRNVVDCRNKWASLQGHARRCWSSPLLQLLVGSIHVAKCGLRLGLPASGAGRRGGHRGWRRGTARGGKSPLPAPGARALGASVPPIHSRS